MNRIALVAVLVALLATAPLGAHPAESSEETIVFVVRHAEKASDDRDALLSEKGLARAASLARVLSDAGIDAIYTTQYQRTRLTAEPLARAIGIEATSIEANAMHVQDLASRIRSENRGGKVLVVGHSNTVPPILAALGISKPPVLEDDDYDGLYVVTLKGDGTSALLTLYYGE